eukprot:m.75221 g.75221  ORF g.75221 m.75221 type:complete len:399 (-) comp12440_c0_seq1:4039-5235(-)
MARVWTVVSGFLASLLDIVFVWMAWWKAKRPNMFFTKGFGNMESVDAICEKFRRNGVSDNFSDIKFDKVEPFSYSSAKDTPPDGITMYEVVFASPIADVLPEESKEGRALFVVPKSVRVPGVTPTETHATADEQYLGPANNLPKGVVIHMAATGDQWYKMRQNSLANSLAQQGYVSILLMIPYYGKRKPADQKSFFVTTAADYLLCAYGCTVEGVKLLKWVRNAFDSKVPVCVTGLSYGGAMAAMCACYDKQDLALCPCLGSPGPSTLVYGGLSSCVDYKALAEERVLTSRMKARDELLAIYDPQSIAIVMKDANTLAQHGGPRQGVLATVAINAASDHIIPHDMSVEFQELLQRWSTKIECAFVPGGHVSTMKNATQLVIPAIIKAFDLLEAAKAKK